MMLVNKASDMDEATRKLNWIRVQIAAGRTVYLTTYTKVTKITRRTLSQVRATEGRLEVQHGRRWLDHSYSRLSAK